MTSVITLWKGRTALRGLTITGIMIAVVGASPASAPAAVDQREMRAREAFAVGHYQEALELFAKLYAEKVHPNYLRNIGRCYQNLGDPDKAITSFTDYLRKAKSLPPEERAEVEGYIKEMEDLKAKRQAGTTGAGPPGPLSGPPTGPAGAQDPTAPVAPSGSATPPATTPVVPVAPQQPPPAGAPGADLTAVAGPAATADEAPVYQRWWFWALIGGAAAVGLGVAAAAGAFTKTEDARCPGGTQC